MTYQEAEDLLNKYKDQLIGQPLVNAHGEVMEERTITHLFICPTEKLMYLFDQWYYSFNATNKDILFLNGCLNEDLDIFVCSSEMQNIFYYNSLLKYLKKINLL